jgi:hypothetical protein
MALPISVYFNIADAKGDVSTVTIPIPSTVTLPNAVLFTAAMAELIQPLVTGSLRDCGFSVSVTPGQAWPDVSLLADVQEKATFNLRTVGGWLKKISLPTFFESLFAPNSKVVNTANGAVAAFVTALEDGVSVGGNIVRICDSRGDLLDHLESAVESWGKSRG